jgi:hypothetical protein
VTTKLPKPGQDLADALAELAAAPQIVLVLVDERNRILDIRRATPAFVAAQLIHTRPDAKGDMACGADAGSSPSSSA